MAIGVRSVGDNARLLVSIPLVLFLVIFSDVQMYIYKYVHTVVILIRVT